MEGFSMNNVTTELLESLEKGARELADKLAETPVAREIADHSRGLASQITSFRSFIREAFEEGRRQGRAEALAVRVPDAEAVFDRATTLVKVASDRIGLLAKELRESIK
jgi:hypothetical protein